VCWEEKDPKMALFSVYVVDLMRVIGVEDESMIAMTF
jgi:hypothetical protein